MRGDERVLVVLHQHLSVVEREGQKLSGGVLLHSHAFAELDVNPASPVREKAKARGTWRRPRPDAVALPLCTPALLRFLGVGRRGTLASARNRVGRARDGKPRGGPGGRRWPSALGRQRRGHADSDEQARQREKSATRGSPSRKLDHALTDERQIPGGFARARCCRRAPRSRSGQWPPRGRPSPHLSRPKSRGPWTEIFGDLRERRLASRRRESCRSWWRPRGWEELGDESPFSSCASTNSMSSRSSASTPRRTSTMSTNPAA